jgi:hypothetical protein
MTIYKLFTFKGERLVRLFKTFEISLACACLDLYPCFYGFLTWLRVESRDARGKARIDDFEKPYIKFCFSIDFCYLFKR